MATAQLRKTFRYPSEYSDDDEIPADLDEEEQEKLIKKLKAEVEERNEQYKRIFLAIPFISAMTFMPALITSPLWRAKLISLLSMTSLLTTAYILIFLPNPKPEPAGRRQNASMMPQVEPEPGPVHRYLSYMNGGLSLLIGISATTFKSKPGVHGNFWVLCILPAFVFSIILVVRHLEHSVDFEELERSRYEYKGA